MSVVLKDIDVKKRSANDYGTNKINIQMKIKGITIEMNIK